MANTDNESVSIVGIRDDPRLLERGIDYLAARWRIDRRLYADCIGHSIATGSPLPRWYLMLRDGEIIGSYGLITNDFISRQDLVPWLCALYVNEEHRGRGLGARLLDHGRAEAARLGFGKVYLCTDHVGYYEKFGWNHIGAGFHPWGEQSRIYECTAVQVDLRPESPERG